MSITVDDFAPPAGNPAPRVHERSAGMLNSVGLQGPGIERWLAEELPAQAKAAAGANYLGDRDVVDPFSPAALIGVKLGRVE